MSTRKDQPVPNDKSLENRLKTALFRITCPDTDELMNFVEEILPQAQMVALSKHLKDCPYCAEELKLFEPKSASTKMRAPLSSAPILEQLQTFMARLVFQPALVRNAEKETSPPGEKGNASFYEIEKLDWQITLSIIPGEKASFTLQGQLFGPETVETADFEVNIIATGESAQNEAIQYTKPLAPNGTFILEELLPGVYALWLNTPAGKISLPAIKID
jgi:hypothetical protein